MSVHRLHGAVRVEDHNVPFREAELGFLVVAVGDDAQREGIALRRDVRGLGTGRAQDGLGLPGVG